MSFLSKLFGGKSETAEPQPEIYKDMRIIAKPQPEGRSYRLSARIEHDIDGDTREHVLIRADMFEDLEQARTASVAKAKQMIDEQGVGLFD